MLKYTKSFFVLAFICLINYQVFAGNANDSVATISQEESTQSSTWERVAKLYLPSLNGKQLDQKNTVFQTQAESIQAAKPKDKVIKIGYEKQLEELKKIVTPDELNNLKIVLANLDLEYKKNKNTSGDFIFDDTTFRDLLTFCGKDETPDHNFIKCTDNTLTTPGRAFYVDLVYNPLTSIDLLNKRQTLIKELVNNESLYANLLAQFKIIQENEHSLFSLLSELNFLVLKNASESFYTTSMFEHVPLVGELLGKLNYIPAVKRVNDYVCDYLNSSPKYLEVKRIEDDVIEAVLPPAISAGLSAYLNYNAYLEYKALSDRFGSFCYSALGGLIFTISLPFLVKETYKQTCARIELENLLFNSIKSISKISSAIKTIRWLARDNSKLSELIEKTDFEQNSNKEFNELIKYLDCKNFEQDPSWKTSKGKTLVCLKYLCSLRNEFIPYFIELGKIDAHLSIASLYKKHAKNSVAKYHFAEYQKQATPHLKLENFWNPFLDVEKVVVNSIELGGFARHKNILITGPNAGGKSTALKAMAYSVLLAQTLTICPCDAQITPFSKVFTTLNITDSVGKESLFQADKNRIKEVLSAIEALSDDQFALVISDEMFNSTGATYGSALFYGTLRYINDSFKNTIFIAATHFEKLTEIEVDTNKSVANFRVEEASIKPDGSIGWSYKLLPGINTQNISLDLVEEDGFNPKFIQAATNFLGKRTEMSRLGA